MSFERLIQFVKQGEPVAPGATNRAPRAIQQNVEYLWEIIQAAYIGSTIYARQVTIEADAQVGMPVYLNGYTQQFERGLAQVETDGETGLISTAASSQVWGIVATKHNATLADLLLYGYAQVDISAAVGGTPSLGAYYLSGVEAGKLVRQRPPVSVPVLRQGNDGYVFVNPSFVDFLDSHRHYRFELLTAPAGEHTPPTPGDRHEIVNANSAWPGWLPADDPVFEGKAPTGAVFGYNMKEHPQLLASWPPLPMQHVYLEWDKGEDPEEGYEGVPLGTGGLVTVNRDGIWWMSNCYGDVPWPKTLDTAGGESVSAPPHEHVPPECPRETRMSLVLWFTRINFVTDATVVTSLVSIDDRIKIYCAGTTNEGSVGDLEIDLDLGLMVGDDDRRGYLAFKELEDERLHRGPVCEGIYAVSENVSLTSPFQTLLDPDDEDSAEVHHGPVGITVLPSTTRELQCQLVRLDGATEENYPVLYLGLPSDVPSGFILKFEIPGDVPAGSQLTLRARLLGRAAGNLPPLGIAYLISPRPSDGLNSPVAVTDTYTSLAMDTIAALTAANQAVEAESDPIDVTAGDILYIRVLRDPEDALDEYAGDVGFMQQVGILTSGV